MAMAGRKLAVLSVLGMAAAVVAASERAPGSAVVTVDDSEYSIAIECNDATNAAAGFSTEPNRITRERTKRSNGVRLTARPWKETDYWVISLDRYIAWIPAPPASGPMLEMTLNLSKGSSVVNGMPQALTFDQWMEGVRPEGLSDVNFVANCASRDPAVPSYRKIPTATG